MTPTDPRFDGQSLALPRAGGRTRTRRKIPRPKHPQWLALCIAATVFAVWDFVAGDVFRGVWMTVYAAVYWRVWIRAEAGDPFATRILIVMFWPMLIAYVSYAIAT
jgi:hypothetical protein